MAEWILREELASKKRGVPVYLEMMTAIGPCCTDRLEKAAKFASKQDAMNSPAFVHIFSFFEPEPVGATQKEETTEGWVEVDGRWYNPFPAQKEETNG